MNEFIQQIATELRSAADRCAPIDPVRGRLPENDLDAAYKVQDENTRYHLSQGRRIVGRKIGLTSPAVQKQLGVTQPDFGMLFADMEEREGLPIPVGKLIQPKIEAEIAFILGRDLTVEQPTIADVLRATEFVLPALEIVDSRIRDWSIQIVDTIADNASSGLYVLGGPPRQIKDLDLRNMQMVMHRGDEQVSQGTGSACLGSPLNAFVWLASEMVHRERPLQAGDVILSGALGPMVAVQPGDLFVAQVHGLGSVSAEFAVQPE